MHDPHTLPLLGPPEPAEVATATTAVELRAGLWLLRRYADPCGLREPLDVVLAAARPRRFVTPGGRETSAAMTNCGPYGWTSDRDGYRYSPVDPQTGRSWPPMPAPFVALAQRAATAAGFAAFVPDACLVNRYAPGAGMTAHQDRDELDFSQPIVSVSLGLPATFFWHEGDSRRAPARSVRLTSGDVVVFGGPSRRMYHGVRPVRDGVDPTYGAWRYNLTFRKAK